MHARRPFASAQRSVRLAAALAIAVALGIPGPGHAQIVRDGTVGPAGPLTGPNYIIAHTDGTRAGGNLFHSFSRFNIQADESATFTGPSDIRNVLSRVTGGEQSTVDGQLRSKVGSANFFLINPAGVVIGPNAHVDVPAAFYVANADNIQFSDGIRFSASNPAASQLSIASPQAFGFNNPTETWLIPQQQISSIAQSRKGGAQQSGKPPIRPPPDGADTGGRTISTDGGIITIVNGRINVQSR